MRFAGRRILVTGAGKGIGRATACQLAAHGATVIALGRTAADLDTLIDEALVETLRADLMDFDETLRRVRCLLPIDGLVNCAGIVEVEPFLETRLEHLRATMTVNVEAPLGLAQLIAGDCIGRGLPASVVNVSSIAATVGTPGHSAYCASKAALDALTRVMAVELGGSGIRVNSVNPVVTWTPMAEKAWGDPDKAAGMKARIPLGRFAEPAEVAAAIRYLLSDDASMVNGICLPVDGGFTAG